MRSPPRATFRSSSWSGDPVPNCARFDGREFLFHLTTSRRLARGKYGILVEVLIDGVEAGSERVEIGIR